MDSEQPIYRILDASLNRALEGLRVCEDYARFVLNDARLTLRLKELRHALAVAAAALPLHRRHAARDVTGDVGTGLTTPTETGRADAWHACLANFSRVKEALRTLEEYGKTVAPEWAAACEQLRYRVYALEAAATGAQRAASRLADVRICVLIEGEASPEAFAVRCRRLLEAGADMLQLRDKRLTDRELAARARQVTALVREVRRDPATRSREDGPPPAAAPLAIVNDRSDIAGASDADGVHLGQDDLSLADARAVLGPDKLIGVSTHSLDQADAAVLAGADYLGAGPTFPSETKQFAVFPGLAYLQELTARTAAPAFAIGGITPANVGAVRAAGATRLAVARVAATDDPRPVLAALRRGLADSSAP